MKRVISMAMTLCFATSLVSASSLDILDTTLESYAMPQPINREILTPNQLPTQQQPTAEQTAYIYDDPYLSYQWAITQMGVDLAWETLGDESACVVVAVVDTGVDYTHEDLENRVLVDLGYDFVNDDDDPMDDNGHGTHVSGIIAAEADNGLGIAGVVGTLDVAILPIKVLDSDGSGETGDIAAGVLYAVEMEADIINLSLGADVITPDVRMAIETALQADIFVVVASGNDGTVCTPLSLASLDGVFTVAAATDSDTVADFSNYGDCIDGYAPGEDILSTYLNNQYAYQDGTSMAAPMVTGAAAILLSQNPDLTNAQLTALLSDTTTSTQISTVTSVVTTPVMGQSVISVPTVRMQAVGMPVSYVPVSITVVCNTVNVYQALLAME